MVQSHVLGAKQKHDVAGDPQRVWDLENEQVFTVQNLNVGRHMYSYHLLEFGEVDSDLASEEETVSLDVRVRICHWLALLFIYWFTNKITE